MLVRYLLKPAIMARNKKTEIPGIIFRCESGRCIAFYEHRTDIIANGENEKDAKKILKKMYKIVTEQEEEEERKHKVELPPSVKAKSFKEKIDCL